MPSNFIGELLGTMMLIILGNGVVAGVLLNKSKAENAGWIAITAGWAFAVVFGVFTAISAGAPEGDINPAVTIGKFVMGTYTANEMVFTIIAQMLGAIIGAVLVWLHYLPHWDATRGDGSEGLKLAAFSTGPAIRNSGSNLISEILGTVILLVGVGAIFSAATRPDGPVAGLGPFLVGMLVWGIGLSLGGPTGYAINPARDLGPRIAHAILPIAGKGDSDWSYSWIPVVGPIIGGIVGALIWMSFFPK